MESKLSSALIALSITVLIGLLIIPKESPKEHEPQISPCNCLTYKEWQLYSTRRDNALDKLYGSPKSKRQALHDTVSKYSKLLGIETLDNYPER